MILAFTMTCLRRTYQSHSNTSNCLHALVVHRYVGFFSRLEISDSFQNFYMWQDIELGAQFYFDESDYITDNNKVKIEPTQSTLSSSITSNSPSRGRKRPRRIAKETVRSYVVPDSDEDLATSDQDENEPCEETNLQLWIKHLSILLKAETRKVGAQYIWLRDIQLIVRNSIL